MVKIYGLRKHKKSYTELRQKFEVEYHDLLHIPEKQDYLKVEWEKRKMDLSERLVFTAEKRKWLNYLSDVHDSDYDLVNDIFWLYFSMVGEEYEHQLSMLDTMKYAIPAIKEHLHLNHPLRKPLTEAEKYTQEFLEKFEAHRIDKKGD